MAKTNSWVRDEIMAPYHTELMEQVLKAYNSGSPATFIETLARTLKDALQAGIIVSPPPFPPDREVIEQQKLEISRLRAQVILAKSIMGQKDQQITSLKSQKTLIPQKNAEIDRLLGVIARQKDEITALQSDPTTDEGRFNIERQYEREFTNTSHLMQQVTDLQVEVSEKGRMIEQLQTQNTTLQQAVSQEGRYRHELQRVAARPWR